MPYIRLDEVTLSYADGRPVLEQVNLHLGPGWTAVVGENGAGKTTLLRGLTGALTPALGTVHQDVSRLAFVPQRVDCADSSVQAFAQAWSKAAMRLRRRLVLEPEELTRWSRLSQGQRKRWQVGAALHEGPDVLVLDEPSNHLDSVARELLLAQLSRFSGVGVLVSHDRAFLEALAPRTVFVAEGKVRDVPLPYGQARAQLQLEREQSQAMQAVRASRAKAQLRSLRQTQAAMQAAGRQRSAGRRMKNKYDSDARGMGAGLRAAKAEAALARRAGALRTRVAASQAQLQGPMRKDKGGNVSFEAAGGPGREVLRWVQEPLQIEGRALLEPVTLSLRRGERVQLCGPNGSGKSTLLRRIEDLARSEVVRVAQDRTADEAEVQRRDLVAAPTEQRSRVMQRLAALGTAPAEILGPRPLTPGQAQKLALAVALATPADLLLLDEPTSHLDLPAIERLQDALTDYEGALILVTHDPALGQGLTRVSWRIVDGQLRM